MTYRLDRLVLALDWNSRTWTVDLDLAEVSSLTPGWLKGLIVVSCVGADGVGLSKQAWANLLEGSNGALFKLECEGAARELLGELLGGGA